MRIGPWWVDTYTLRIAGAAGIAVAWLLWAGGRRHMPDMAWGLLGIAVPALAFGRAGYILTHPAYFRQNPGDMLAFRAAGGSHGMAALVGGLLGALGWAALSKQRPGTLLTLLTPAALWVAAGAWWACADVGCVWGKSVETSQGLQQWIAAPSPDLYHMVETRIAVPTLGMALAAATTLLAVGLGARGLLALPLYLAGAAGLTLVRADPAPAVVDLRLDTILHSGLALLCALAGVAHLRWERMRNTDASERKSEVTEVGQAPGPGVRC